MLINFSIKPRNDEHIQDVQKEWYGWKRLHEDALVGGSTLLVVHTYGDYTDLDRWIEIGQSGGGVLFITGAPAGERTSLEKQLSQRHQEWPSRWSVLTTPLSGANAGPELRARFGRFLTSCAGLVPNRMIPWDQLYSMAVSESVLSIYLWCLAQPTLSKKGITVPEDLLSIGDQAWRDLCTLNRERGIKIPVHAEFKGCLELNGEACEKFTNWVKKDLLSALAQVARL